jgi:hypothetical protein
MGKALQDRFRILFSKIGNNLSKNDNLQSKLADKSDEKNIFNV